MRCCQIWCCLLVHGQVIPLQNTQLVVCPWSWGACTAQTYGSAGFMLVDHFEINTNASLMSKKRKCVCCAIWWSSSIVCHEPHDWIGVVNMGGPCKWEVSIYGVVYSNMVGWFSLSGSLQVSQPFCHIKLSQCRPLVGWHSYGNELIWFEVDNL